MPVRTSVRRLAFVVALALWHGCGSSPTELCACSPLPTRVDVFGTVTTAEESPAPGAVVRLEIYANECGVGPAFSGPDNTTTTDETGRYEIRVDAALDLDAGCLRGVASRDEAGDSVLVDRPDVLLRPGSEPPERVRMDFRFR